MSPDKIVAEREENMQTSKNRMELILEAVNASPVYRHLNMRVVHAQAGVSRVELPVAQELKNLYGTMHGGLLATLVDSACGVALATRLEEGETLVTMDLRINYLLPVEGGILTAEGTAIHKGRKTGVAEASVRDDTGRLVAKGMTSHVVLESPGA